MSTPELKRYRVVKGIFENHVFQGHPIKIRGEDRIWDEDSMGNAFPSSNCEVIE
ncbi:MAG: hypothetical protein IMZ61_16405 [Planctomycetes bacterium]|nr:hypothetical protein [Planctomycetota bacterium]